MSKPARVRLVTGDMLRDRLLELAGVTPADLRRAMDRTRDALDATLPAKRRVKTLATGEIEETIDEGGAPDWDARLKASDQLCDRIGLRGFRPAQESGEGLIPITAVAIVLHTGEGKPKALTPGAKVLEYRHLKLAPTNGHTNGNGHGA